LSCSTPLENEYRKESFEDDMKALSQEVDSTDMGLIFGMIMTKQLKGESLEGSTYKSLLDEGKAAKAQREREEAEQKALAEKAAKEEAERIARLKEAATVTVFEKGYAEANYQDFITMKFAIKNKSEKEIRAIKGMVVFTNLFDEEIKSLNFVYDKPIGALGDAVWNARIDYNQFSSEDQSLRSKSLEDLKIVWEPEKIIFTDGSSLE